MKRNQSNNGQIGHMNQMGQQPMGRGSVPSNYPQQSYPPQQPAQQASQPNYAGQGYPQMQPNNQMQPTHLMNQSYPPQSTNPYGYPQQPYPYGQPPVQAKYSGLAITSFVLAIISMFVGGFSVLFPPIILLPLLALILAIISLVKFRKKAAGFIKGKGLAIAALVLSIIATIGTLFWLANAQISRRTFEKEFERLSALQQRSSEKQHKSGTENTGSSDQLNQNQETEYQVAQVKIERKNDQGRKLAVLTYDLTYQGDKKSNAFDITTEAFQNGVELQQVYDVQEARNAFEANERTLKKGGTKTVTEVYECTDDSIIELEIRQKIFSFDRPDVILFEGSFD